MEVPTSSITHPESAAFCDGNVINGTVSLAVQLGVHCEFNDTLLGGIPFFADIAALFGDAFFHDLVTECGDQYHEHGNLDLRFTCLKAATFPVGSSASDTQVIPQVSIMTDYWWNSGTSLFPCVVPGLARNPSTSSVSPALTPIINATTHSPSVGNIGSPTYMQPLSPTQSILNSSNTSSPGSYGDANRGGGRASNALIVSSAVVGTVVVILVVGLIIFVVVGRSKLKVNERTERDSLEGTPNEIDTEDRYPALVNANKTGDGQVEPKSDAPLHFKDQTRNAHANTVIDHTTFINTSAGWKPSMENLRAEPESGVQSSSALQ